MLINSLGPVAIFALAANAFMIPSTMSLPNVVSAALPPMNNLHSRLVTVPCPGCLMPDGTKNVDNSIVLDMKISEDGNHFLINDLTLYPSPAGNLKVSQVSSDIPFDVLLTSLAAVSTEPRPVLFNAGFRAFPAADGSDAKIIEFDLQIVAIGDQKVQVDKVYVRLLKGDSKEAGIPGLVIHDVAFVTPNGSAVPFEKTPVVVPLDDNNICADPNSLLCKMRAFIVSKTEGFISSRTSFSRRKGCHGGKRAQRGGPPSMNFRGGPKKFGIWRPAHGGLNGSPKPPRILHSSEDTPRLNIMGGPNKFWRLRHEGGKLDNPVNSASRPCHYGPGHRARQRGFHGHNHHHALHSGMQFVRGFVMSFVIPVMIGVAAGMIASVLGMLVGSCIAWLWIKFVRGGRSGNASGQDVSVEECAVELGGDEKKRLVAEEEEEEEFIDDEPLPIYVESEEA